MEALLDGLKHLKAFRSAHPKVAPLEADIETPEDRDAWNQRRVFFIRLFERLFVSHEQLPELQEDDLVYYVPTAAASLAAKPKDQPGMLSRFGVSQSASENKQPATSPNGKLPNNRFALDYNKLFFVRRRSTRTHPDQGSPLINWEHTFYLNLIMQYFRYSVSCTIAQMNPGASSYSLVRQVQHTVSASASTRRMDTKDWQTILTWPRVYFTLDDFEQLFEEFVLAPNQVLLVRLHVFIQKSRNEHGAQEDEDPPAERSAEASDGDGGAPPAAQSRQVCLFSGSVRHSEFVNRVVACEKADQEAKRGIGQRLRTFGRQLFAADSVAGPAAEDSPTAAQEETPMQFQLGKRRYIHLRGPKRVGFAHVAVGLATPSSQPPLPPVTPPSPAEQPPESSSDEPDNAKEEFVDPSAESEEKKEASEQKSDGLPPADVHRIVDDYLNDVYSTVRANVLTFHKNRARLHAFFMDHDPERLGDVDEDLRRFQGREEDLFRNLYLEYKVPIPQGDLAVTPENSSEAFDLTPGTPKHPKHQPRTPWSRLRFRSSADESGPPPHPSHSRRQDPAADSVLSVKPSEAHLNVMLTWIYLNFEEIIDKVLQESFPDT